MHDRRGGVPVLTTHADGPSLEPRGIVVTRLPCARVAHRIRSASLCSSTQGRRQQGVSMFGVHSGHRPCALWLPGNCPGRLVRQNSSEAARSNLLA